MRPRFDDGSWFRFPATRWSFSHIRELMPTAAVERGPGPVRPLPRAERPDIDGLTFTPQGQQAPMTWAQSLEVNHTDGILVLHDGRVVYERYVGELTPERPHLAFSVTKSFVGTLAAMLMADGTLHEDRSIAHYLPELDGTGIGDATLRHALDMVTGLAYVEDYSDPSSSFGDLGRAGGFLARSAGYRGADSFLAYFATLGRAVPHGSAFAYKTVNTDVVGAVLTRVTGLPLADLLSRRLFSRLGAEQDAYFTLDPTGAAFAGAGLNLCLRDLARFGELMRRGGEWDGDRIVPKAVIDDIRRGGDRDLFARGAYAATLPGWSYRTQWWVTHDEHGAFAARGIHGQTVYVDPAAAMVIARFASHPLAGNVVNIDPTSLPAYRAVAARLAAG